MRHTLNRAQDRLRRAQALRRALRRLVHIRDVQLYSGNSSQGVCDDEAPHELRGRAGRGVLEEREGGEPEDEFLDERVGVVEFGLVRAEDAWV